MPDLPHHAEPELDPLTIERARRGDRLAQAAVLRRYARPLHALVRRAGVPGEADDLTQELLTKLLVVLPRFDPAGPAKLTTWVFTVAHRWLLDERKRRHLSLVQLDEGEQVADATLGAEQALQNKQLGQALEEAISRLPEAQRRVFILAQVHQHQLEAVAEAEGVPLGTLKSRLHRARAQLASWLGPALDRPREPNMVQAEELEQLSRLLDGELDPAESARLQAELARRPELAQALERLRNLGPAAATLSDGLSEAHLEALVARSLPPRARGGLMPGVLAALGLVVALSWAAAAPGPRVTRLLGEVHLGGQVLDASSPSARWESWGALETLSDSAAAIRQPGGALYVGPGALLRGGPDSPPTLQRGSVVLEGSPATLATSSGEQVRVEGRALARMEPPEGLGRVTQPWPPTGPEESMARPSFLLKLAPPAGAAAAACVLTLAVTSGRATVSGGQGAPVSVAAGETWRAAAPAAAPPAPAPAPLPAAVPASVAAVAARGPEAMTREELQAEVASLRGERGRLLAEKDRLQKKLEERAEGGEYPRGTYYRIPPEDLRAAADRGELRLRVPQMRDEPIKVDDRVSRDLSLTDAEKQEVLAIYRRSHDRIHEGLSALYREIGGEPGAASTLGEEALLREVEGKSLPDDSHAAVREVARERAGLPPGPASQPGSAVLRAFRLLWQEDDRVIDELDALLGPDRARGLLEHSNSMHSNWSMRVGPGEGR